VSSTGETDSAVADSSQRTQEAATDSASKGSGMGSEESLDSASQQNNQSLTILEGRTTGPMLPVYYDFDQSNIKDGQKERLENNAMYLKDNSRAMVTVEGNCDERGTNEYNMALGERRALSAKKYLMNLGVAGNRISTISYGEEKPLNHGHDELAWSQNRRADFVLK
nr:peptidoglycan-associated lipoprotein Pal [Desulfobulbaceae bacterium]